MLSLTIKLKKLELLARVIAVVATPYAAATVDVVVGVILCCLLSVKKNAVKKGSFEIVPAN